MRKEDCKKGMLVYFGDTTHESSRFGGKIARGVVIKVNPKRAKVKSIDPAGGHPAGCIWNCSYFHIFPVVGGEEISNEMTMRSFENPDDLAVKTWSEAQKSQKDLSKDLLPEDKYIMHAIHEIYVKLEDLNGKDRSFLSDKINILFRALGREVSKKESELWVSQ